MALLKKYDVAIIGGGPGGYVAAVRAAQNNLSVCLIERNKLGGVCLNWGCIPSKSLIHSASGYKKLSSMESFGVKVDRTGFSYAAVQEKSRQVVGQLTGGVEALMRKNKVKVINASASLRKPGEIALSGGNHDGHVVSANHIIIATGSHPLELKGFEFDEQQVISSSGLLNLKELPKSLVILGAGAIGCEFAYIMNIFGVKVTMVEMAPQILPGEDSETVTVLARALSKSGIEILNSCTAESITKQAKRVQVALKQQSGKSIIEAEKVLVAFGRSPNTRELGLDEIGVSCNPAGYIETGDFGETSVDGVYAIGDVTTTPLLAHVASKEAELAVNHISGILSGERKVDPSKVPSAVYCEPQLAGFGLREQDAIAKGIKYSKSVFPYHGAGKAIATDCSEGIVKVLVAAETGELLGAHIVGADATELIHQLLLVRHGELLMEDLELMIHAHPTLSEAILEAARGVNGSFVHG